MKFRTALLAASAAAALLIAGAPAQAQLAYKNALIGGDFGVNPYQRGTAAVTGITTTGTFHADRWFAWTSGSSAYLTQITAGLPSGIGAAEQLARTAANSNTTAINLSQILENSLTLQLAGQTLAISYYAQAAANFSGTGVQPVVTTGTGTSQSMANYIAGTWTNQANIAGIPLQPISTTAGRYSFCVQMPSTATEAAVDLSFNGVGTAGTTDGVILADIQVEVVQPGAPGIPCGPTTFERRLPQQELALAQRFGYGIAELAAGVVQTPVGTALGTTTTCTVYLPFPVPMRAAPTYTNTLTASTFKLLSASQAATALSTPFSATLVANGVNGASVNFTTTGMTAKDTCAVVGAAGTGLMFFSAEY